MNRLEGRVIRLERDGGRNGWRAHAGVPMEHWPDDALLGFLADTKGWPPGYDPSEEMLAIASAAAVAGEDGGP